MSKRRERPPLTFPSGSELPSQLSDKHISSFQELYLQRFGKELNRGEAQEKGLKLLRLMQLIYKPITLSQFTQLHERKLTLAKSCRRRKNT